MVEHNNIDKSAISRQVRLLLELKLIDRQVDPDDSRANLLIATEEGARLIDELQITRLRRLQATFPHLTPLLAEVVTALAADNRLRERG